MATNPAVSLPRAGAFRVALKKLELFIVSETTLHNDTIEAGPHVPVACGRLG
jgi:assimilatory nitrate reductase catalytic subunit